MTSAFWALLALLAVAQAAPPHAGRGQGPWEKRQAVDVDVVLTETRVEVFSETRTETFTETFTSTERTSSAVQTDSASATTTSSAVALPLPQVHFAGDVANPDPAAQSIMFMPLDTPGSVLPTDTDSTASPTSTALPSPVPSQSDSNATDASTFSGDVDPAFAAQSPVVQGPLVSAYYPDWAASDLAPEKIDMTRVDWIDFAFAMPDQNFNLVWDDADSSPGILTRVVSAAHAKGTKVKLSIGGWDGSQYFSAACASAAARTTFVNNILKFYNQFHLDGIDIDWEYPGQQGAGSNGVSPQDSANFLAMLKMLRAALPKAARITAAVQDVPFADTNGNPMKDVSAFAAVLDWVNIMNYDVFSSSDTPGPNAPLANGCHDSSQPDYNAVSAISAWTAAKFPASRLMLGVPAYGYLNPSHATKLQHKKRAFLSRDALTRRQSSGAAMSAPARGTHDETESEVNPSEASAAAAAASTPGTVTIQSGDGTTNSGQLQFTSLVAQGALLPVRVGTTTNNVSFVAINGFTRFWDSCSSTPFLSSPYSNQVVTYDDPQSLGLKAAYAKQQKILGTAVWDLSGDTAQWDLMNALRAGLGKTV